jgi:glucose-1-phosphate thymidylyltransferase
MLDANRMVLTGMATRVEMKQLEDSEFHGHVHLDDDVEVKRSILRGPIIIGKGSKIVDAYIGPFTSIGPGSRVEKSEVENSIILENCQIVDIGSRMSDSLIGRNVVVRRGDKPPRAYRFMVGDNSEITVL